MNELRYELPLSFAIALIVAVAAVLIISAIIWRIVRSAAPGHDRSETLIRRVEWPLRVALTIAAAGIVVAVVALIAIPSPEKLPDTQVPDASEDPWALAWSDEFDGDDGAPPNPEYWTHEIGGGGWGNEELQYYTDSTENAALDGEGNLVITARGIDPATTELECWYGPCTFTSARLITVQKQEFTYGRIETRVRVPGGAGLWPAVWMLGADFHEVGWPQTGEIDIMEFVGNSPNEIFGTIHGPGYSGGQAYGGIYDLGTPVFNDWHDFTVEWSPENIVWAVDGVVYHEADPADVAPNEWVFDHPFFFLANMAVGGNFGGAVGDGVEFPKQFTLDYVRVYQTSDIRE